MSSPTLGPYDRVTPGFFTDREFAQRRSRELIKPLPGLYLSDKIQHYVSLQTLSSRVVLAKLWLESVAPRITQSLYAHNLIQRPYRVLEEKL